MPRSSSAPAGAAEAAHLSRRPGSVRRTTTIDMTWPDGATGSLHLDGRARDLHTPYVGDPEVVDSGTLDATLDPAGTLVAAAVTPRDVDVTALIGGSVGSGYRRRLGAALPTERATGSLVHLLLDDLVGAAIVSEFALRQWGLHGTTPGSRAPRRVVGLCTGFTEGSTALHPDGTSTGRHRTVGVASVHRSADPAGWHVAPEVDGVTMRRARRIDAWTDDDTVHVDAMFQDSSTDPAGGRRAVHEYRISLAAAAGSGLVLDVAAVPRILPYHECPFATAGLARLVGTPLAGLRDTVPSTLRGTAGCTHLNDALRGLADVPGLLSRLQ